MSSSSTSSVSDIVDKLKVRVFDLSETVQQVSNTLNQSLNLLSSVSSKIGLDVEFNDSNQPIIHPNDVINKLDEIMDVYNETVKDTE